MKTMVYTHAVVVFLLIGLVSASVAQNALLEDVSIKNVDLKNTQTDRHHKAKQRFKHLQTLVGEWRGKYKSGRAHQVSYKLLANGSALAETWTMSEDRESLTVYTLNDDSVLATHYCPQGNQVVLQLSEVSNGNKFHFTFLEGRNLHDQSGHHQSSFWVQISGGDSFMRSETYIANNASDNAKPAAEGEAVAYQRGTVQ